MSLRVRRRHKGTDSTDKKTAQLSAEDAVPPTISTVHFKCVPDWIPRLGTQLTRTFQKEKNLLWYLHRSH